MRFPTRFFSFLLVLIMLFVTMAAIAIPSSAAANQYVSARVGDTKTLILNVGEAVHSSFWTISDLNAVSITASSSTSCTIKINASSSRDVVVHCEYYYWYLNGTFMYLMTGVQDFIITISGSSSGGNNGGGNGGWNDSDFIPVEDIPYFSREVTGARDFDISYESYEYSGLPTICVEILGKWDSTNRFDYGVFYHNINQPNKLIGGLFGIDDDPRTEHFYLDYDHTVKDCTIIFQIKYKPWNMVMDEIEVKVNFYCSHPNSDITVLEFPSGASKGKMSFTYCSVCDSGGNSEINYLPESIKFAASTLNNIGTASVSADAAKNIKNIVSNSLTEYLSKTNNTCEITVESGIYDEKSNCCNLKVNIKENNRKSGKISYTKEFKIPVINDDTAKGDVNCDGKVNLKDIAALMKYTAKWCVLLDQTLTDVTGDGKVNLADASLLLKHIAKWDVVLK